MRGIGTNWGMITSASEQEQQQRRERKPKVKQERWTITITEPYHGFLSFTSPQERREFIKLHLQPLTRYSLGNIFV